ncbi:MAG: hypothetical protein HY721_15900 [Planctomycetes bacterium]|nr:hypothetical protein [Planctomycetota bacterium]
MSLIILDDQLAFPEVQVPILKWFSVTELRELDPARQILDDRVPELLLRLKQPTFVTIDQGFWERRLCNLGYCILMFALRDDQQVLLPGLLRKVMAKAEFLTRGRRMGAVARISSSRIERWRLGSRKLELIPWTM